MRVAQPIELTAENRETLTRWSRGRSTPTRLMQRAKIVLLAAAGEQNKTIAARVGVGRVNVARWRKRFAERGLAGIEKDAPGRGRPARKRDQMARQIVEKTLHEHPPAATHWSTRNLAQALGISHLLVHRVCGSSSWSLSITRRHPTWIST